MPELQSAITSADFFFFFFHIAKGMWFIPMIPHPGYAHGDS